MLCAHNFSWQGGRSEKEILNGCLEVTMNTRLKSTGVSSVLGYIIGPSSSLHDPIS